MKLISHSPAARTCLSLETSARHLQTDPIARAIEALVSDQSSEGYWWYTLEANESIGAGFILLMHFLGASPVKDVDSDLEKGLVQRILSEQRPDGSWALFYDGPPDLSITIECYLALRLAGLPANHLSLTKARTIILKLGGLDQARVFTQIHLALFGLVPWSRCPSLPVWFILLPVKLGISIYEFCSWARQSIVPLMVILDKKPVVKVPFTLEELNPPCPPLTKGGLGGFFLLDKFLKKLDRLPWHPGKKKALQRCEEWIREHLARTEDIYPAMAYGAMAIKALGYPTSDPTIQKALNGLKSFQQECGEFTHQQCCISPLWDTPWACRALLESGLPPNDPRLLKAAQFLIRNQITEVRGDWRFKNPDSRPGGWAFEFQNDYFPDVDDTIEILHFLHRVALPDAEKNETIRRGLDWLLSMQSDNGGWGAFDKNNTSGWVNRIPFSDHGACLDPPTPDITGRAIELLSILGFPADSQPVRHAKQFLYRTQESCGAWRGRWGVNFIYGTWCVLQGLIRAGEDPNSERIQRAFQWLRSIQNSDGGWGESCLSDKENRYVPLNLSIPSQTAWAVMGLLAAGEREAADRGVDFLQRNLGSDGRWEERHFTGTGFPGHFYIRYHGYRQYFPLLALGKYASN